MYIHFSLYDGDKSEISDDGILGWAERCVELIKLAFLRARG